MEDSDVVALLSSTGLVLAASFLDAIAKLLERVIIVRSISQSAWGDVSIGLSILLLGTTFATVGLGQGIPRYISRFERERDVRGTWFSGLVVSLGIAVAIAALLYVNAERVAALLFEQPDSPRLLRLFVVCIPLLTAMKIAVGGIRGMENIAYKVVVQLAYPVIRIGLLVALLAAGLGVLAPGIAYLVAVLVLGVLAHVLLGRLIDLVGPVRTYASELLRFSVPLMLSALLMALLTRTDTLMVGYFRSSAEVGLYSAAYPLANGMLVVLTAIGYLYLPMASRFDAAGEREEVNAIYELTTKWALILTFPLFLLFALFPGDVLAVVFTPDYRAAGTAFVVLALGGLSSLLFGRCQETMSALGHTGYILVTNASVFGLNVALNLVLIPRFGIEGAAATSALSFLLLNAGLYGILRVQFHVSPFSRYTRRTVLVLFAVVLPVAALGSRLVDVTAVTVLPVLGGLGAVTVVVVTVSGCLQREDRVMLEAIEEYSGVRVPLLRRYLPE